jgi:hypothetical protein
MGSLRNSIVCLGKQRRSLSSIVPGPRYIEFIHLGVKSYRILTAALIRCCYTLSLPGRR